MSSRATDIYDQNFRGLTRHRMYNLEAGDSNGIMPSQVTNSNPNVTTPERRVYFAVLLQALSDLESGYDAKDCKQPTPLGRKMIAGLPEVLAWLFDEGEEWIACGPVTTTHRFHVPGSRLSPPKTTQTSTLWIARKTYCPFSLENICYMLGIDLGKVRGALKSWIALREAGLPARIGVARYRSYRRADSEET